MELNEKLESTCKMYDLVINELQSKLQSAPYEFENTIRSKDSEIVGYQKKLKKAIENANPDIASSNLEIQKLLSTIAKKDSEIAFLKETVRVECEERMGLVSSVAKLQLNIVEKPRQVPDQKIRPKFVHQNINGQKKNNINLEEKGLARSASNDSRRVALSLSKKEKNF